jgi:hypothetical protein
MSGRATASSSTINHIPAQRRIAVDLNPEMAQVAAPGVEVLAIPLELSVTVSEGTTFSVSRAPDRNERVSATGTLKCLEASRIGRTVDGRIDHEGRGDK